MRDFHSSFKKSDLVEGFDIRRQTSMDAENFSFNHSSNAEIIKDFTAVFPRVRISVFADSLIVETVHRGDLPSLVVST